MNPGEELNEVDLGLLLYMTDWFLNELEGNDPEGDLFESMRKEIGTDPQTALNLLVAKLGLGSLPNF